MIHALLVLALAGQEADVAVTGHGRRHGGEYEVTVAAKGKGLRDQEVVTLKFRRLSNRIRWEDGALLEAPAGEEIGRVATVENQALVHRERFAVPGDVELRLSHATPDGAAAEVRRVFRASTLPEQAHAIGGAARKFDAALRGLRMMLDDLDAIREEMCPPARRQAHLQKRIEWRKNAYREEVADSFLGASAGAVQRWIADLEAALDLDRNGKGTESMVSSLTGEPFCWEEVRGLLAAIETASLRERALLMVKTVGAIAPQIAEAVRGADAGARLRAEKELTRALDTLEGQDRAWRSGPSADAYAAAGEGLEGLLSQARELMKASSDPAQVADLGKSLLDQADAIERRLRAGK
jgi:hypothetical protein